MILRRAIAHVRRQDWTAVFIELCIVVLGVFLGMQVNNWNEQRVAKAQERAHLGHLRAEIVDNRRVLEFQTRYIERVVAGGRSGLRYLEGGSDCLASCEEVLVDLFHASQLWGTGYAFAKFQESERLGFPTNEPTALVVREFYESIRGLVTVAGLPPPYRERVRGHIPPEVGDVLWSGCFALASGNREVLSSDCAPRLRELAVGPVLRAIRADPVLPDALRFWIGQNIASLQVLPQVFKRADAAIAAIDRDLGAVR